jgi:hypothetical protein
MNPGMIPSFWKDAYNQGTFDPEPTNEQLNPMALPNKSKMLIDALRGNFSGAGDGVSAQTHAAMKEAGVGPYEGLPAAPAAPTPSYTPGTDAFQGGRTLQPGYESYGPMTAAELQALRAKVAGR